MSRLDTLLEERDRLERILRAYERTVPADWLGTGIYLQKRGILEEKLTQVRRKIEDTEIDRREG